MIREKGKVTFALCPGCSAELGLGKGTDNRWWGERFGSRCGSYSRLKAELFMVSAVKKDKGPADPILPHLIIV